MQPQIADFLKNELEKLLYHEDVRAALMRTNPNVTESNTPEDKLNIFIEEAEQTIELVDLDKLDRDTAILEVGAGVGISFIYLQKMGYNITGIEPAEDNVYSEYQFIAKELFKIAKTDTSQWYTLSIAESHSLNEKYDLIISNFVLEHVDDTENTLLKLYEILHYGGKMAHNTVNYDVPFEPHLNLLLIPYAVKHTEKLLNFLRTNAVWQTLNFISYSEVNHISKKHQLNCTFKKHTTFEYLVRLMKDPEFRKRKAVFYKIFKILKKTRLAGLIKLLPVRYNTPLSFTITKTTQ